MPPRWKPHTALLRAAFMEGLARRKTAMFAFLGNLAWLIIPYYIWHHVYIAKHMVGGFSWNEMRTYIFWAFLLNGLLTFRVETGLFNLVRTGQIVMGLIRPIDYQLSRLMVVIGGALADACFSIPSVVALGVLFLHPEAPASTERALVFGVSVAIGFLIKFLLSYVTAALSIWTENIVGLVWLRSAITDIFSGAVVPLTFLPVVVRQVAQWSPFQAVIYIPLAIYLGHGPPISDLLVQCAWAAGLWVMAKALWSQSLRRLTVLGG